MTQFTNNSLIKKSSMTGSISQLRQKASGFGFQQCGVWMVDWLPPTDQELTMTSDPDGGRPMCAGIVLMCN